MGCRAEVQPYFFCFCRFLGGGGSPPMHHGNGSRQSYLHTPRHRVCLTLMPLAALYLSTGFTAHAQLNPNLMKYACGPTNGVPGELARRGTNRMFATLSPTSRFTDSTAAFHLVSSPTLHSAASTTDKPS